MLVRACHPTAGHDEERVLQIDLCFGGFDLRGIGGVEDVQLGKSFDLAEREPQDFRAKARTSHAEQKGVLESRLFTSAAREVKAALCAHLVIGDSSQPSQ